MVIRNIFKKQGVLLIQAMHVCTSWDTSKNSSVISREYSSKILDLDCVLDFFLMSEFVFLFFFFYFQGFVKFCLFIFYYISVDWSYNTV